MIRNVVGSKHKRKCKKGCIGHKPELHNICLTCTAYKVSPHLNVETKKMTRQQINQNVKENE